MSHRITSDPFEALDEAGQLLAGGGVPTTPPRAAGGVMDPPGAPQRPPRRRCELNPRDHDGRPPPLGYSRNSSGYYSTFAPLCACPSDGAARSLAADLADAMGTPPGSPGPAAPLWRMGSCGESGPFIGLGYGWTCELARRMARWPGANAFDLKQQMFADLTEEPDLLRDFSVEEVLDGMAHYSWTAERTMEMLSQLVGQREAEQLRASGAAAAAAGGGEESPAPALGPAYNTSGWDRMRAAAEELEAAIAASRVTDLAAFEATIRRCAYELEVGNPIVERANTRLAELRRIDAGLSGVAYDAWLAAGAPEGEEHERNDRACGCRGRYCGDCWPSGYESDH